MARDLRVRVRIEADTTDSARALSKAERAAREFGEEIDRAGRSAAGASPQLDKTGNAAKGAAVGLESAGSAAGRAQSTLGRFATFLRARFVITLGEVLNAIRQTFQAIQDTITLEGQERALRGQLSRIGINFDEFIAKLQEVSAGTVSTANLIGASSRALLLGIPADQIADLLEVAGSRAQATGDTIAKAFDDITLGIGRGSKLILDNLGFVVDLNGAYSDFATTLGKSQESLTDAERRQALLNEVLRQGKRDFDALGAAADNTFLTMQQGAAEFENFKTVGNSVLALLGVGLSAALTQIAKNWLLVGEVVANVISRMSAAAANLPVIGEQMRDLSLGARAASDSFESLNGRVTETRDGLLELLQSQGRSILGFDEQTRAIGRTTAASDALIQSNRGIQETTEITTDEVERLSEAYDFQVSATDELVRGNERLVSSFRRVASSAGAVTSLTARDRRNQSAVDAALASGAQPTLGGTRIRVRGGGTRLLA